MARAVCEICGKSAVVGRSQQHKRGVAGKRWRKRAQSTRRVFKVNLQKKTVKFASGETSQMRICSKCIKRIRNFGNIKDHKDVAFV